MEIVLKFNIITLITVKFDCRACDISVRNKILTKYICVLYNIS